MFYICIINCFYNMFETVINNNIFLSGPSGPGKTVFTKQVLNKSDKQFDKRYWFYSKWKDRYKAFPGITFVSGMPFSLDAYLEFGGPKSDRL